MRKIILGISLLLSMSAVATEVKVEEVKKEKVSKESSKVIKKNKKAGIKEYRTEFFGK